MMNNRIMEMGEWEIYAFIDVPVCSDIKLNV